MSSATTDQRGTCAECGETVAVDGDRAGVRAGRLLCADCADREVRYVVECLDCKFSYEATGRAFNWFDVRQRVQQEGNNHDNRKQLLHDESHETVWRRVDGPGGADA